MATPMALPDNFNPETFMLSRTTELGTFHESRAAAGLAARLVANGTPQDLDLAEKVLDAALRCQELRKGDPHFGNFLWMREDPVVQDLNAVEFALEHLIPMMLQHADRLSPAMQTRVLEGIRLGLDEIRSLDVLVAYSNITALDILNSCLGGELLRDPDIAERGHRKLIAWMAFTDRFGIPREHNSPTYTAVTIRALKRLTDLLRHDETRIRARTMAARLGLSAALHIHPGTGRWAGPHSRAYHPTVVCETEAEANMVKRWVEDGALPAWTADALERRPPSMQVAETADTGSGITTCHSPSFALGVSSKEYGGQSDVFMIHYVRRNADRPGVVYIRYLTNDKWLGDSYHATDRTRSRNLIDEGQFFGVQDGPRAIGVYTPASLGDCASAKAALIWTRRDLIDEVWVGDRRVRDLPATVPPGQVVVVASGEALVAVRPLAASDLGRDAPIRLVEIAGDLVLEIYNYLGPKKTFWDMRWPGAFYKGRPRCGFYAEVAERSAYGDARTFGQAVASGALKDEAAAPFVYAGEGERLWTVDYARDGRSLGLQVDLMAWRLKRRWAPQGDPGWPMLESPVARETRDGKVSVGDATLTCGPQAAWLFASPESGRWAAGYHGPEPAPLTLAVPAGKVEIEAMGTGTLVWDNGAVTVEAVGLRGTPRVTGGHLREEVAR